MITSKTVGRDLPNGDYIEVTAIERDGSDGLSPGFSITLAGWKKRGTWSGRAAKRNGRDMSLLGCDHDTILRVFPSLAPIVACHLADLDGVPMCAVVNGWYYYSGGAATYERAAVANGHGYYAENLKTSDHDRAAQALSIPPADLPEGMSHAEFSAFCDSLAERWASQADAARAALAAMIDGDGVEPTR